MCALFLVYAMLPVIFETVFWHTTNVQTLGRVYALYTAPLWLLVFWYLIKPQEPTRTLIIYGSVISAIVLVIFGQASGPGALVEYVLEFAERIFVDGLQHAEWAAITCFFIGLGLNYRRRRAPLIRFGFLMGAWLHATNDWSTGVSQIGADQPHGPEHPPGPAGT